MASDDAPATTQEVWLLLSGLVFDHERRREVAEALGVSFGRARAVRRVARRPMSMSELADSLGIEPPNATVVVDDLEELGLVRRRPHPTDRRAKLVEPTRKGRDLARKAEKILGTPPPSFDTLSPEDLETLRQILRSVSPEQS